MSDKYYILGASGHAKVIIDNLLSSDATIGGLFDDDGNINQLWNYKCFGALSKAEDFAGSFLIGVGDNKVRKSIAEKYDFKYGKAIHKSAIISNYSKVGIGSVVMAGAIINASTSVGNHVIINTSASIDHDCLIENFAHISPNATLSGNVKVGVGAHIGAGSTILPGVIIGEWSVVGAGAVVTKDVAPGVVVKGVPAS
jgi:acetyltransferase EpsM